MTAAAGRGRKTALHYRHGKEGEGHGDDDGRSGSLGGGGSAGNGDKKKAPSSVLTIPVLGPIPGEPPLVVGADFELNPPTPFQWRALEEAFHLRAEHLLLKEGSSSSGAAAGVGGAIDAAPLVAIMDDYTASSTGGNFGGGVKKGARYATIAAVVGMRSGGDNSKRVIDMSDAESFMESVSRAGRGFLPAESKIRMVGVGRAAVHDFFYQVPSDVRNAVDEDGHLIIEHDGGDDGPEPAQNVVMAQFQLLSDGEQRSAAFALDTGRSARSSPVHALHAMQTAASRIHFLHEDRRNLVAGLKAAEMRLHNGRRRRAGESGNGAALHPPQPSAALSHGDGEDLIDHDGIGMLFSDAEVEATQLVFDKFLEEFGPAAAAAAATSEEGGEDEAAGPAPVSERVSPLAGMANYGMGESASAISSIQKLTGVWLEKLSPYYSPARRETEEHRYEVLSFVSVMALSDFLTPQDLGWSLRCTNTLERLERVYDWMWSHVRMLREEAQQVSQELLDCGEECKDLF